MKGFLKVTKALSDPNRVKIIKMLQQRALCVCEIQAALKLAQPTVSKHLKQLEEAGLVDSQKDGLWVNYRLTDGSSSPAQWTPPSQISQINGSYNFRLGGHTIFCGLFGILGGAFAMWLANKARSEANNEASDGRESTE